MQYQNKHNHSVGRKIGQLIVANKALYFWLPTLNIFLTFVREFIKQNHLSLCILSNIYMHFKCCLLDMRKHCYLGYIITLHISIFLDRRSETFIIVYQLKYNGKVYITELQLHTLLSVRTMNTTRYNLIKERKHRIFVFGYAIFVGLHLIKPMLALTVA